jgi:ribonucleoside-diphosphate reductase alpha chain
MKITRKFTTAGQSPFDSVKWVKRSSRITNPDGSLVFEMDDAEVPETWSQLATDIMVSKYFRKAGVPRIAPNGEPMTDEHGTPITGPERSARQVIRRLAGCWRHWGERHNYFDSASDAQAFEDELSYMLVHQICAPNSPQWFNTGLNWAYGINGPAQGHFYADPKTGSVKKSEDAYTHPQPHACFIQSVEDDLVNDGGIMDLWTREARLFKYGSGTGTNFSRLRAENERLSGGGKSSGLMSWLRIGDRAAGAIKSGGTTRRAAKMVCLDLDHPDIRTFVNWKVREELKVAALVEGMKRLGAEQAAVADRLGLTLDYDFNGEAYQTVSGQNANNSVRIPDEFFDALDEGAEWKLTARTTGEVMGTLPAKELWDDVTFAAWRCADPGVQYDSTINAWHTCPASGRINASNPCSEYMFLDNTACNLASINLLRLYDPETRAFDTARFEHAIDLWTMVLEISVLMAQYPSREIAKLSYEYRTLGLGYANIGAMLMQAGIPYDSNEARAVCGMITSILTGRSYRMSAMLAREHGPFPGYRRNRQHMLRVMRNHRRAAHGVSRSADEWESLRIRPVPIDHGVVSGGAVNLSNAGEMLERATRAWDDAVTLGEKHGYRNAQVTVIAPTGTIGLLMDCDTTGVEPDFALVKFKKLAGGGYFKIANRSLEPALVALGYGEEQVRDIMAYVLGELRLDVPMPSRDATETLDTTFEKWLLRAGLTRDELAAVERSLPGVFELRHAFNAWTVGDDALRRLGMDPGEAKADPSFSLLNRLGLTGRQVRALNERVCGTQTVEGAPHLDEAHLPVFDCANTCGDKGVRFIAPEGHIRMMAAAQPFISGAISKTINLPNDASVEDIASAYRLSWELGLKANALYRDGCKLSQPLSTKSEDAGAADGAGEEAAERLLLDAGDDELDGSEEARQEIAADVAAVAKATTPEAAQKVVEKIVHRPMRRRLPDTRGSLTHKFNVAGHEGYLTVGLYDDGSPGELFITMSKEGSTIGGLMDSLGTATSVALQYGVPIESLVRKFTHQRFEPAGMTTNRDIPFAKSLVDYIFRWMGIQCIEGYREQVVPKRGGTKDEGDAPDHADRAVALARGSRAAGDEPRKGEHDRGVRTVLIRERKAPVDTASSDSPQSVELAARSVASALEAKPTDALSAALANCQEDAPACDNCGAITVRNGACYRCMNCGHSMGCS